MSPNQTHIIEKVRLSGCLSEKELQAFQSCSEQWEARSIVHQWDNYWTGEVPNHIIQVRVNGITSYHLPTSGNSKFTILLGIFCMLGGLTLVPLVPLGLVMVGLGIVVIFKSRKEKSGWENYDTVRKAYISGRRAALDQLPAELHPANRVCMHCLRTIA